MTSLVKMIQDEWPHALLDLDSDKLQIKVNSIDKASFERFIEFTRSWSNKDNKSKIAGVDAEWNSKSNNDEDNLGGSDKSNGKSNNQAEDDEESKNDQSIDTSKYGQESKRFKTTE
jgi:hypothetical protein